MTGCLNGKVAVISGASQGLGLEIAKHYLTEGASLALCARNGDLLEEVCRTLRKTTTQNQRVVGLTADVSITADVHRLIAEVLDEFGKIDILVNNAGIYGPKGEIEAVDWDEWVKSIEVNLFGSVLMCREVLPHFKKRRSGKVIQLSGGGATSPMPRISGYAVSKAAVVRFIETLAEEVREFGIDANAIAPGALNTRMLDEILEAGSEMVGKDFYERSLKQKKSGGAPLNAGAELAVFLGSDESNGITGKLISAMWDKWKDWPKHLQELTDTDVYTLRRITGRHHGFLWGDK